MNCTFMENEAGASIFSGGIGCGSCGDVQIDHTIVAFSTCGSGITCNVPLVINCSNIYGNAHGDWVGSIAEFWGIDGNFSGDPGFCDPGNGLYTIHASSPCAPEDATGCGLVGAFGIGCAEDTLRVKADGSGEYPNIQAALNSCSSWDVVELADGVYTEYGNRGLAFPNSAVTMRSASGDPSVCIIDCEDQDRAISFSGGVHQEAILRGIGITGGSVASPALGGGILCTNASPRIANCIVYRDYAQSGGGIACENGAAPVIARSTISGNSATNGGGLYLTGSSRPAMQNTIIAFSTSGEAVYCNDLESVPILSCMDIFGNAGNDWIGCIEDQFAVRHNHDPDPCFCDEANDDYTLHDNSWCATNSCCGLVGAMPVGTCGLGQCQQPSGIGETLTAPGAVRIISVPNPLQGFGEICFEIQEAELVELIIYDVLGRQVQLLIREYLPEGRHAVLWNVFGNQRKPVSPGVYFCKLQAAGQMATAPLLVVR